MEQGVPKNKIVVGMPFYGRSYANAAGTKDGLFSPFNGTGKGTTEEAGLRFFSDIKQNLLTTYIRSWDDQAKAPYLYDPIGKQFVTYDDEESLNEKARYIKENKLGGAMVWELGQDTRPAWDGLNAINRGLGGIAIETPAGENPSENQENPTEEQSPSKELPPVDQIPREDEPLPPPVDQIPHEDEPLPPIEQTPPQDEIPQSEAASCSIILENGNDSYWAGIEIGTDLEQFVLDFSRTGLDLSKVKVDQGVFQAKVVGQLVYVTKKPSWVNKNVRGYMGLSASNYQPLKNFTLPVCMK